MDVIKLSKVENVRMIDRYSTRNATVGTLYLTATHLIFVEPETNKETWILHMHIGTIEKLPLSTTGSPLLIRCKTFLSVTFIIPKDSECHDVYTSLMKLHQPTEISKLYCFSYSPGQGSSFKSNVGDDYFKLENEFRRMRVPNKKWALCTLNQNYELCTSYPAQLFVPSDVSSSVLLGCSKFRSKGRLPVLTYLHSNGASISRCSQPLSGFSARCPDDEQMFESIRKTNPNSNYMYVVDTRPKINAMANRATGKGYENEAFYDKIKFHFLGIENIHVMRSSLNKLLYESSDQKTLTMNALLNSWESSGWMKHIRSILETSRFIANAIEQGISVVVHCSDGWDRTAQVCSLSALLLDPFYRTIKGFQVSPIFTQFLDATWQLINQDSSAFEFNERFLLVIHDHIYSCQFGTFVGNCEKDRLDIKLSERTYSFWSFIENSLTDYINPLYSPKTDGTIMPILVPQSIAYWRGMYSRFESGVHPREPVTDYLLASRDRKNLLQGHLKYLTKKISDFENTFEKFKVAITGGVNENHVKECDLVRLKLDSNDLKFGDQNELPDSLDTKQQDNANSNNLLDEMKSIAIDWKSQRTAVSCSCLAPFDQFNRKTYCWKCGEIFCPRCIEKSTSLPGMISGHAAPVCKSCFRNIHKTSP